MSKTKLTLEEVALLVGVSPSTIRRYVHEFSDYLEIDPAEFDFQFEDSLVQRLETVMALLQKPTYETVRERLAQDPPEQGHKIDDDPLATSIISQRRRRFWSFLGWCVGVAVGSAALVKQQKSDKKSAVFQKDIKDALEELKQEVSSISSEAAHLAGWESRIFPNGLDELNRVNVLLGSGYWTSGSSYITRIRGHERTKLFELPSDIIYRQIQTSDGYSWSRAHVFSLGADSSSTSEILMLFPVFADATIRPIAVYANGKPNTSDVEQLIRQVHRALIKDAHNMGIELELSKKRIEK